jgi:hypothetical protein
MTEDRTTGRRSLKRPSQWEARSRWGLIALLSVAVVSLPAWLIAGVDQEPLAILAFLVACMCVALIVVALPKHTRARYGVVATAFVGAAGVLALFTDLGGSGETSPATESPSLPAPSIDYAAELLARGPFTGDPAPPLTFVSLQREQSVDVARAVAQVALRFEMPPELDPFPGYDGPSAYLWLFRSTEDAGQVAAEQLDRISTQYAEFGEPQGNARAFNAFGNGEIIAGGFSGPVYCEGSIAPDSNANVSVANELVSACLRYADDMVALSATR